ncbi:hypothetical protein [Brevundimonas sp.]|uniref:hypothetical protein n=1 Tax=Brevundimonas sp. TaxID=1871086 RepID=UPI003D13F10B
MTEASSVFYPLTLIILLGIIVLFAMKYAASIYRSRLDAKRVTASDETLAALRQEVSALTARLNAVEKLLREVE